MTKTKGEQIDQKWNIIDENSTLASYTKIRDYYWHFPNRNSKILFQYHRKGYENQRKEFYIRNPVQAIIVGFKQSGLSTKFRKNCGMGTSRKSF